MHFRDLGNGLEWRADGETLRIEAWGPARARWTDAGTGREHAGGQAVTVAAPIERIPLFVRDDARPPLHEEPR
jgi:alpha-glucosidase (family GH31 glycosyl hydrolase)